MAISLNEWFVFTGVIDNKTCNKIKRLGAKQWQTASVDTQKSVSKEERRIGKKGDYKPDPKSRITDVAWTNDQWVYNTIWPFMIRANDEAGWGYEIKAAESSQITRYKKGGFYNFHRDGAGCNLSKYNNPTNAFMHDHVRKLSMTVLLSNSFEGGDFEFTSYGKEECIITPVEMNQGDIVVFPSWMEHRVAPVTKGIRYSLVTWFVGPPFK